MICCPLTLAEIFETNFLILLPERPRVFPDAREKDDLRGVVRTGLDVCEQGIAAFRKLHEAVSVHY